jgi:hypothetical protein
VKASESQGTRFLSHRKRRDCTEHSVTLAPKACHPIECEDVTSMRIDVARMSPLPSAFKPHPIIASSRQTRAKLPSLKAIKLSSRRPQSKPTPMVRSSKNQIQSSRGFIRSPSRRRPSHRNHESNVARNQAGRFNSSVEYTTDYHSKGNRFNRQSVQLAIGSTGTAS